MNSFELNKVLGAILGTCLALLSLNIGAGALFAPEKPAKPGFDIAVKEDAGHGAAPAAKEPSQPIEVLMASASAETITVTIDKLVFSPSEISVKAGDTVEWLNKDALAHTATVKGGWEVSIPPGKSATHVVTADDSVDYYCRFHPNMTGRIKVVA